MEHRRDIVPHPLGGWDVTDADGTWFSGYFVTLCEAEGAARAWLQAFGGGWLVLHGTDGSEATFEVGGATAA